MAWNLNSALVTRLQNKRLEVTNYVNEVTISLTSNTIDDANNGLGVFADDDFIHVTSAGNLNAVAQCITATAAQLIFAAGVFTVEASGAPIVVQTFSTGSIAEIMKNGFLELYTTTRPGDVEAAPSGTLLAGVTKNSALHSVGAPTNGLNMEEIAGGVLKRAIDPETGIVEEWQGDGVSDGDAGWGRWYSNDGLCWMDGAVTTVTGGDIVMANGRTVAIGSPATVTDVALTFTGV